MPDFADKKAPQKSEKAAPPPARDEPAAKPINIRGLGDNRPTVEKKENPIDQLNREMRSGFKRLEDKLGSAHAESKDFSGRSNIYNYEYNNNSYTTVNPPVKEQPKFKVHEPSSVRTPVTGATSARPAPTPAAPVSAPANVAPVADKRAHEGFAKGSAANTESDAARLQRVTEAAERMEKGEFPANPKIREWAGAVNSGRTREVADLNPRTVNSVVEKAVGGSQEAKKLDTPKVAQLETEHQTRAQVLQKGLESRQEAISRVRGQEAARTVPESVQRGGVERSTPDSPEVKISSVASPGPRHEASQGREQVERPAARGFPSASPASIAANKMQDKDLTFMLRHNDESHATSAVSNIESTQRVQMQSAGGEGAQRAEVKGLAQAPTPKVGSVTAAPLNSRADSKDMPKMGKAPWGDGRDSREGNSILSEILTAIRRLG